MPIAHLQLSIDLGSEPIEGSVSSGTQRPQQFSGWIELAEAIEAVRTEQAYEPYPGVTPEKD